MTPQELQPLMNYFRHEAQAMAHSIGADNALLKQMHPQVQASANTTAA